MTTQTVNPIADPLKGWAADHVDDLMLVLGWAITSTVAVLILAVVWHLISHYAFSVLVYDTVKVYHSAGDKVDGGDGDEWASDGWHTETRVSRGY